jgi:hypothetical protein
MNAFRESQKRFTVKHLVIPYNFKDTNGNSYHWSSYLEDQLNLYSNCRLVGFNVELNINYPLNPFTNKSRHDCRDKSTDSHGVAITLVLESF